MFEVGPGASGGLQRELLSKQFDLGDNTLDKKIKHDLEMNSHLHEEAAQSRQPSFVDGSEPEKRFLRSQSNSFYRKDFQQCSLQLALEQLENARAPSERNGDSTQEQTLDVKQLLIN